MSEVDESSEALRLVVADDSPLLREGVVKVLSSRGFDVVGEAAGADKLLRKVDALTPDDHRRVLAVVAYVRS